MEQHKCCIYCFDLGITFSKKAKNSVRAIKVGETGQTVMARCKNNTYTGNNKVNRVIYTSSPISNDKKRRKFEKYILNKLNQRKDFLNSKNDSSLGGKEFYYVPLQYSNNKIIYILLSIITEYYQIKIIKEQQIKNIFDISFEREKEIREEYCEELSDCESLYNSDIEPTREIYISDEEIDSDTDETIDILETDETIDEIIDIDNMNDFIKMDEIINSLKKLSKRNIKKDLGKMKVSLLKQLKTHLNIYDDIKYKTEYVILLTDHVHKYYKNSTTTISNSMNIKTIEDDITSTTIHNCILTCRSKNYNIDKRYFRINKLLCYILEIVSNDYNFNSKKKLQDIEELKNLIFTAKNKPSNSIKIETINLYLKYVNTVKLFEILRNLCQKLYQFKIELILTEGYCYGENIKRKYIFS